MNQLLEIKKDSSNYKKRKSVVFPVFLFIIVLIVVFLTVFKVNRSSNEVDNDFCEKEIKLAFNYNGRNVYYNCLSEVYIDEIELRLKLSQKNFDFEDWLNQLTVLENFYDGGSTMYRFDQYKILSCNTIEGDNDIIIGNSTMEYENNLCNKDKSTEEKCFYTDIFRVVDILDSYVNDDIHYVFITVDQFQDPNPINVKIEKTFLEQIQKGYYYEFQFLYYLPNDYVIHDNIDIFNHYELVSISPTSKEGLLQERLMCVKNG